MKEVWMRGRITVRLLCATAILWSAILASCNGNNTIKTEAQQIQQVIQPAAVGGQSSVEYYRVLTAGTITSGNVNVTGDWEVPSDYCSPWTYQAFDPGGNLIDAATEQIIPYVDDNPYYYFNFTAATDGKYTIQIITYSILVRYATIVISPPGWQLQASATS